MMMWWWYLLPVWKLYLMLIKSLKHFQIVSQDFFFFILISCHIAKKREIPFHFFFLISLQTISSLLIYFFSFSFLYFISDKIKSKYERNANHIYMKKNFFFFFSYKQVIVKVFFFKQRKIKMKRISKEKNLRIDI